MSKVSVLTWAAARSLPMAGLWLLISHPDAHYEHHPQHSWRIHPVRRAHRPAAVRADAQYRLRRYRAGDSGSGGVVVQFVGDAVMAVFNAPTPQPDHALRAAHAGVGLRQAVARIAEGRPEWPRFRGGVNTGSALVGTIGAAQMRNYTAIGDTTDTAARLQGVAHPGDVVIGPLTRVQLGPRALVEPLHAIAVKGRREPVSCFVLRGVR